MENKEESVEEGESLDVTDEAAEVANNDEEARDSSRNCKITTSLTALPLLSLAEGSL